MIDAARALGREFLARSRDEFAVWSDVRAFPPLAVWSGVICVALMLVGRRIVSPRSLQLSGLQLAATATFVAVLAIVVRGLLSRMEVVRPSVRLRLFAALMVAWPTLTLLAGTARSLSFAAQSWIVAMSLGSAAIVWGWDGRFVDALLVTLFGTPETRKALTRSSRPLAVAQLAVAHPMAPATSSISSRPARTEAVTPEGEAEPLFHLERSIRPDGVEELRGSLRIEFLPGQSLVSAHIAFSPSFPRNPEFTCEVVDQAAVRVKGTTVYPYGARIELKAVDVHEGNVPVKVRFRAELREVVRRSA